MKYVLLLALLCGGGYYLHQKLSRESDAVEAYKIFAYELFQGHFDKAKQQANSPDAIAEIDRRRGQQEWAERSSNLGSINKLEYRVKSENYTDGDTKATFVLAQKVHCGPRQIMSQMSSTIIYFDHSVEMVKVGDAWKVTSFKFMLTDPKPGAGSNYTGMD